MNNPQSRTIKRTTIFAGVLAAAMLSLTSSSAMAAVSLGLAVPGLSVQLGTPPVYYSPPPVYYAPPPSLITRRHRWSDIIPCHPLSLPMDPDLGFGGGHHHGQGMEGQGLGNMAIGTTDPGTMEIGITDRSRI